MDLFFLAPHSKAQSFGHCVRLVHFGRRTLSAPLRKSVPRKKHSIKCLDFSHKKSLMDGKSSGVNGILLFVIVFVLLHVKIHQCVEKLFFFIDGFWTAISKKRLKMESSFFRKLNGNLLKFCLWHISLSSVICTSVESSCHPHTSLSIWRNVPKHGCFVNWLALIVLYTE